jgi:3'(2'), 5'-bisphosphate nucleotidase
MSDMEEHVTRIAREAGAAIMQVYQRENPPRITTKPDDTPVTEADTVAHEVIKDGLLAIDDSIPIISEEGRVGDPGLSDTAWLVDPLDGTKEFIKKNGMFTVNIALMSRNGDRWAPRFGVVYAPVSGTTWMGGAQHPAERTSHGNTTKIRVNQDPGEPIRLVASGSHRGDNDEAFATGLGNYELIRMGSSLKACVVAEGSADVYPRFGPTSCWDIAAAHAVVEAAGGIVVGPDTTPLDYDILEDVLNPFFMVACSDKWNDIWKANQD